MAFTFGEFARGAMWAWWTFQWVYLLANLAVDVVVAFFAHGSSMSLGLFWSVFAFLWSVGALLLLGGPLAWLLGRSLRRVPRSFWHLIAFGALGLVVGAVTTLVATQWFGFWPVWSSLSAMSTAIAAVSTAIAVAFGWRRTAKRALAGDARLRASADSDQTSTDAESLD
ncbi:hypothetical protein MUN74_07510 [Agromyces endophyticus]|uniref:hypothetical protein n=1 Tax=Agromyces sp. H17E-10 TaxID=2932244 RepID=UPI001FD164D6|nr:hypothetical protein [Agromyces sp. H17E-10]UOQ90740.1 hypothetical protein MUN74_07510 [Agromyces sp. H17E-10]